MPTQPPFRNRNVRRQVAPRRSPTNNQAALRRLVIGRENEARQTAASSRMSSGERIVREMEVKPVVDEMADNFAKIIQGYGKQQFDTLKTAVNEAHARPRSLGEQTRDIFDLRKYAGGLLNFGKEAAITAVAPARVLADGGEAVLGAAGVGDGWDPEQFFGRKDWRDLSTKQLITGAVRHYAPAVSDLARSLNDTSTNLRHFPSRYAQASDEGRILDTAIADIGNIAIVLGGLGAAAKAGAAPLAARAATADSLAGRAALALDTAGTRLRSAATLGAKVNDAPATVPLAIGKFIGKVTRTDTPAFRAWMYENFRFTDPAVQEKRAFMARHERLTEQEIHEFVNEYQKNFSGIDHNIEQAVNLYRQNMPYLDDIARRYDEGKISEQSFRNIVEGQGSFHDWNKPEPKFGDPYNITIDAVRLAQKYRDGTIHPDIKVVMDKLNDFQDRLKAKTTEQALSVGLNPEQLGDQPLTPAVNKAMAKPLERYQRALNNVEDSRRAVTEAELKAAEIKARVTQTFDNGKKVVYRSRLTKQQNYELGKAELRLAQAKRALGLAERRAISTEQIARTIHDRVTTSDPKAMPAAFATVSRKAEEFSMAVREEAQALRVQGIDATELEALAGEWENLTLPRMRELGIEPKHLIGGDIEMRQKKSRGPSQNLLPKEKRIIYERTKEKIAFSTEMQLRQEMLRMMDFGRDRAAKAFTKQFGVRVGDILDEFYPPEEVATFSPFDIEKALDEHGWKAYSPKQMFASKSPATLSVDDFAIDKQVWQDFVSNPIETNKLVRFMEAANRSWKNTVLPLSVMWHTGNTLGGAMIAMIGGGVNPVDMVQATRQIIREMKKAAAEGRPADLRSVMPFELQGMSLANDNRRFARIDPTLDVGITARAYRKLTGSEKVGPSPFRKFVNKSYEMNDWVDTFYRSVVYLTKVKKGLSIEDAVAAGIRTMGDFSNLSTTERRVYRNILPFYPWMKHITKLAFRLPIEHPMRVIWTMKLAQEFAPEEDPDALPWEVGSIEAFGRKFNPSILFPFADVGTPLSPNTIGQSVSPVIKAAMGITTGLDIGNWEQIRRPIPEGGTIYDRPSGSMLTDPIAALNFAGSQFSIVKKVRNIIDPTMRYPTGEARMVPDDSGQASKIRLNLPHYNADGELVNETVLARDELGKEMHQPDVAMRSGGSLLDRYAALIGVPVPAAEQYTHKPLEITARPNGDGTYSYTYQGKRYTVQKQNGYDFEAPESWSRYEEEGAKKRMREETMRALLNYRLSRAGG